MRPVRSLQPSLRARHRVPSRSSRPPQLSSRVAPRIGDSRGRVRQRRSPPRHRPPQDAPQSARLCHRLGQGQARVQGVAQLDLVRSSRRRHAPPRRGCASQSPRQGQAPSPSRRSFAHARSSVFPQPQRVVQCATVHARSVRAPCDRRAPRAASAAPLVRRGCEARSQGVPQVARAQP